MYLMLRFRNKQAQEWDFESSQAMNCPTYIKAKVIEPQNGLGWKGT